MNKNAKKWVVAAWKTATEKSTIEAWTNLQSMLLVLQCCAGKAQESDDYYAGAVVRRTRNDVIHQGWCSMNSKAWLQITVFALVALLVISKIAAMGVTP